MALGNDPCPGPSELLTCREGEVELGRFYLPFFEINMVGIYSKKSKSGIILAERLGFPLLNNYSSCDTVIRWGSTSGSFAREINTAEAINNASDKERARKLFIEAGLPTPLLLSIPPDAFPCVGRPPKHFGGKKFFYCYDKHDAKRAIRKGCTYFSSYYPKTKEYRVHIGGGKLLGIAIKEGGDPYARNWNYRKGYRFRYLRGEEWDIEAIRLAKKAIKALGLDFGAVDILAGPVNNLLPPLVVCEANTTPALCPFMINKYVEYFKRVTQPFLYQDEDPLSQEPEEW